MLGKHNAQIPLQNQAEKIHFLLILVVLSWLVMVNISFKIESTHSRGNTICNACLYKQFRFSHGKKNVAVEMQVRRVIAAPLAYTP